MKRLMKNKNLTNTAFTLIELLAVIIILAIVALIATPIILDVVADARISAGRSEANMILSGINNYCATEDVKQQLDNNYTKICTKDMNPDTIKDMVNLGTATIDKVVYDGEKLTELEITSNSYKFRLCPSGTIVMDDEKCDEEVVLVGSPILEIAKELVYSNGTCKTDGSTYQYMDGCYIKGNPTNNYIWYSGFLWRIMGINSDGTARMITDEIITSIPWGTENTAEDWDSSHAKDWLNNYFYPRLKGNSIIKEETWCSEIRTGNARITCTDNLSRKPAKVGLITIDEYLLADGLDSYLNIGKYQWTMTPKSSSEALGIDYHGYVFSTFGDVFKAYGLRAVINVNSDAIITSGNGTFGENWSSESGPYILNEDKNVEITGKLNEKSTSGEYVMFAGRKYRVVDKDSNGNTKLILDGYYEEDGNVFEMKYNETDTNEFSKNFGIGQKLNTDVLNWIINNADAEKEKLVTNYTWYQNNFDNGQSYTIALNETKPTRTIEATVGLIRVGEMLSGPNSNTSFNQYYTMTPCTNNSYVWKITDSSTNPVDVSSTVYIRPVIVIKSSVEIIGGTGTFSNPYQI